MSLTSFTFGVFLLALFVVYFAFPRRFRQHQWIILLIGSYVFYISSGLKLTAFLFVSTITTWSGGLVLGRMNARFRERTKEASAEEKKALKQASTRQKRKVLFLILLVNIGILAVLKYSNFVIENINLLRGETASPIPKFHFLLPLGISFYTFQAVGYVIDVYRGKYEPDRNLLQYALFVSYFPQIIQGPISRHADLAHQLYEPHAFDYRRVTFGLQRSLWGYFKKMVIADRLAVLTAELANNYLQYKGFTVFLGVVFYTLQIYADFSGGMDVICGISEALGIKMVENFERPYFSTSIAEFWQRWHITLGSWMREYVFYPLALSKPFGKMAKALRKPFGPFVAKVLPTSIASFIVFILVGLWHGADWKYIAYGLYQAFFVSTGTLFQPLYTKGKALFRVDEKRRSWKLFQMFRTIFAVTLGRYFIHANSTQSAIYMMKATVSSFNPWIFMDGSLYNLGLDSANFNLLLFAIAVLFFVDYIRERGVHIRETIARQNIVLRWTVYFVAIFSIIIFGMYGPGYDASSFIYQNF